MCVSCGCGSPEDDHGDERNLTLRDLRAAAAAAQINLSQLGLNLQQGLAVRSGEADVLAAEVESLNQPLPSGIPPDKLESTPYPE